MPLFTERLVPLTGVPTSKVQSPSCGSLWICHSQSLHFWFSSSSALMLAWTPVHGPPIRPSLPHFNRQVGGFFPCFSCWMSPQLSEVLKWHWNPAKDGGLGRIGSLSFLGLFRTYRASVSSPVRSHMPLKYSGCSVITILSSLRPCSLTCSGPAMKNCCPPECSYPVTEGQTGECLAQGHTDYWSQDPCTTPPHQPHHIWCLPTSSLAANIKLMGLLLSPYSQGTFNYRNTNWYSPNEREPET